VGDFINATILAGALTFIFAPLADANPDANKPYQQQRRQTAPSSPIDSPACLPVKNKILSMTKLGQHTDEQYFSELVATVLQAKERGCNPVDVSGLPVAPDPAQEPLIPLNNELDAREFAQQSANAIRSSAQCEPWRQKILQKSGGSVYSVENTLEIVQLRTQAVRAGCGYSPPP
jgi:hypothetical protein